MVLVALISGFSSLIVGGLTLIGVIITNRRHTAKVLRDSSAEAARKEQLLADWREKIETKLEQIDEKMDEHNGYAVKFGDIATEMAEIRTDIKWIRDSR